jgi:hypothetical protein
MKMKMKKMKMKKISKMRSAIFLTIGFLLPFGSLAAQDHDGDSGQYVILNAQYGTEHHHVDVTHRLRQLARHDERFRVEYNTFNADLVQGGPKLLRVYARGLDGQERAFDFPDGSLFDGAKFRDWGRADWGDEHWNGGWNGRNAGNEYVAARGDARDDHDSGEFVILSAQYGTARKHVDVTHRLKELARHDRRFRLENGIFGVDPDRGRLKTLRIYARGPNGREHMFEYPEYGWIDGSQFRAWGSGQWANENDHWSGRWDGEERDRQ